MTAISAASPSDRVMATPLHIANRSRGARLISRRPAAMIAMA